MKKTISIIIMTIILIMSFSINIKTFAAVGSFSVTKNKITLKEGKSTTFTINVSNCEGKFLIESSNTEVATVSTSSEWIEDSVTVTVKAESAGTANITVTAANVGDTDENDVEGTKIIKVTVKEVSNSDGNTSNNNTTTEPAEKEEEPKLSTNATLKNLGITPSKYDFTGFKSGTTSYNVEVPNNVEKISIYATPAKGATVSGTGSKKLEVGKNTFSVKVTAEDKKTTKTYKLIITRAEASEEEEEPSTDATLKNLGITPREYDFSGFKPETTRYSLEVQNDVEKISIYAYAKDAKATVTGAGTKTLEEGENKYSIEVTAEDKKTTKTYELIITRVEKTEEEPEQEDPTVEVTGLTSLQIAGYTLNPEFTPDVHEYTLDITDMVESLDIRTSTSDTNTTVEIVGNSDFKDGENLITILVHNSTEDKTDTYQIIVNIDDNDTTIAGMTQVDNTIEQGQEEYNKQQKIVKIVIIAVIVLIIIFLIARNKIRKDMDYDEDEENQSRLNLSEEDEFFKRINNREEMPKAVRTTTNVRENTNSNINSSIGENKFEANTQPNFGVGEFNVKEQSSSINRNFNEEQISRREELSREPASSIEELREIRKNVREDKELDDFDKMDNLEEILRARKNRGSHF